MSEPTQPLIKTCSKCRYDKPLGDFGPMNTKRDGLDPYCRLCRRAYSRDLYAKNPTRREKTAQTNARRRDENWALVEDYLRRHPCIDCGEDDILVLDFDHRDRSMKTMNVSKLMGGSTYRLKIEMAKCDIRCANCHRRKTALELGFRRKDVRG